MSWILQNMGPLLFSRSMWSCWFWPEPEQLFPCFHLPGLKAPRVVFGHTGLSGTFNETSDNIFFSLSTFPVQSLSWDAIRRGGRNGTTVGRRGQDSLRTELIKHSSLHFLCFVFLLLERFFFFNLTLYNHTLSSWHYCLVSQSGRRSTDSITMMSSACLFSGLTVLLLESQDHRVEHLLSCYYQHRRNDLTVKWSQRRRTASDWSQKIFVTCNLLWSNRHYCTLPWIYCHGNTLVLLFCVNISTVFT